MPHPKPNPLFVKKPGETTSQHMSRLRKEFPKKFGMQKGHKVVKKKFTAADLAAAEKRAEQKAVEKLKAEIAQNLTDREKQITAADLAAAVADAEKRGAYKEHQTLLHQIADIRATERTIALPEKAAEKQITTVVPVAVAPVAAAPTADNVASATLSIQPAAPDTQIFGEAMPPPPKVETPLPGAPPVPPPEPPPGTPGASPMTAPAPEADGSKYGMMIWAMIVKLCVGIFGPGFEPMTVKDSQGHVIYDEGAEGVKVWVNYLASIGVKVFSPVVELWIFMGSYVGIRSGLIIAKFRKKKTTPATAAPGTQPESKEPGAQPASPAAKAPAPAPPPPPAPAATPDAATGVVELDDEHFGAM
jgi:hypothetical protein